MTKVLISQLDGTALNWAVAKCEGYPVRLESLRNRIFILNGASFSTEWAKGGPIIEKEGIHIGRKDGYWAAQCLPNCPYMEGPSPLVAAMRCLVASKCKEEFVEVPDELIEAPLEIERQRG